MSRILARLAAFNFFVLLLTFTMGWMSRWRESLAKNIDDPTFTQPLRANLFQSGSDRSAFHLLWTRPSRRENRS